MTTPRDDPHFLRTLREARLILAIFAAVTAIVLVICYRFGYRPDPGLRATLRGTVEVVSSTGAPTLVRIEEPPRKDGSPGEAKTYDVPAGWEVRVARGQVVGHGALLAAPPGRVSVPTVAGLPRWVFWGILAPWGVCTAITLWFAAVFMRDEDALQPPGASEPPDAAEPPGPPAAPRGHGGPRDARGDSHA